MSQKSTLDPQILERHYGLAAPVTEETVEPFTTHVPESRAGKLKVLLTIGAIAASPFVVTKVAEALGNTEQIPGSQHNTPTVVQPNP